jgi:plasmid stabilization system protein ParE
MTYRVELTARAARDLNLLYEEKHAAESRAAARWFNGLEKAVYTLEVYPLRCAAAPERKKAKRSLRHLLYGKKPHVYRVIFQIDERNERNKLVQVLTIRHGAMEAADLNG